MKVAAVVALVLSALLAAQTLADERYSNDDLCRAIGETPALALQPRDRLFFEKNCVCFPRLGCMEKGGVKASVAAEAVAKFEEQQRKAAETAKARRAELAKGNAAAENRAVKTCSAENDAWSTCDRTPGEMDCTREVTAFEACCRKAGVPDWRRCSDLFP